MSLLIASNFGNWSTIWESISIEVGLGLSVVFLSLSGSSLGISFDFTSSPCKQERLKEKQIKWKLRKAK